jgi:hypothetical protein
MASIFDAYAQAYDKSLNQEAKLADALRVANLQRQQQAIQQAQEGRQAQRFNFELQNLQAETPNKVLQANIMNSIFSDPAFQDAVRTGKISGAQATALMNSGNLDALKNLGADLPTALGAGLFQNLNAANQSQRQIALGGNDPAEVSRLFGVKNPRKENGFWLDDAGKKIYSSPAAGVQANMWEDYMNKLRGGTSGASGTSDTTPMAGMTGKNMSMAPGFEPINPLAGTTPVSTPVMPAVTAIPAMPTVPAVGETAQPSQPFFRPWVYDLNDWTAQNRAKSRQFIQGLFQ